MVQQRIRFLLVGRELPCLGARALSKTAFTFNDYDLSIMRAAMRSILALAFLVFLSNGVEAKIIYVNNIAGSNRNSGAIVTNQGDGNGPLRTIAAALLRADRGDRIQLANSGVPYRECIALQGSRHSGTAFSPFILDGNGATLDGSEGHRVGITLYNVRRAVIHNLVVRGFQLDGINAHDNAFECALSQVTCEANGRSGISVGGASSLQIVDCISLQNGKVQLRTEGWSTTSLARTRLVSTSGPAWTRIPSPHGLGARLWVESEPQAQLQGFSTAEDLQVLEKPREPLPQAAEARPVEQPTEGKSDEGRPQPTETQPTQPLPGKDTEDADPFQDDAAPGDSEDPFDQLLDEATVPETEENTDQDLNLFDEPDAPAAGLEDDPFAE